MSVQRYPVLILAMPIVLATSKSFICLHYPSRIYSELLPEAFKAWQKLLKEEKIEKSSFFVMNKSWGDVIGKNYASNANKRHTTADFVGKLNTVLDCKFEILEISGESLHDNYCY